MTLVVVAGAARDRATAGAMEEKRGHGELADAVSRRVELQVDAVCICC